MLLYSYALLPLLFLPIDSSSIRDRNFKNDLVPPIGPRLGQSKEDGNSLKVVSNDPFIIQLDVPKPGENVKNNGKVKDTKNKMKKRAPKPLKTRQRRDVQATEAETKSNSTKTPKSGNLIERRGKNATENAISKGELLKALYSHSKKRDMKTRKDVRKEDKDGVKAEKYEGVTPQLPDRPPILKMVYPTAPKTDKHSHKYTYKDLMADRERLEKKIKYIRNMLNVSSSDDLIRVRRRSESDRTANKIAKMFLTLSAVNGLHDKLKSKCDDEDDEDGSRVQDVWEKERKDSSSKKSSSSNEERYKVKKWIEHLKSKRSSSKTCPCMARNQDEEYDVFPLEQKLPKSQYLLRRGGSSEESSESLRDPHFSRDKPSRAQYKRRNHRAREDSENKLKALAGKGSKKLELPFEDLELYRAKAKQILQNAEEILDKIKEEEEKRLAAPNILMNQLKELTSRIQSDPRSKENDLIRKVQKNIGRGLMPKSSPEGVDGNTFLENVKSFILDPYEKAKALTDESAKKLSSYLLRNLGELQESEEEKESKDQNKDKNESNAKVYFGQVPRKEEDKPSSANLAREKPEPTSSKSKEALQTPVETVSSALPDDENKKPEDLTSIQEEQFKKRMQEMIKEQEKQLNEYEIPGESAEGSSELAPSVGSEKAAEVAQKEEKVASPKEEIIKEPVSTEKDKTVQPKESESVPEKEISGQEEKVQAVPNDAKEEEEKEILEEIIKEIQETEDKLEAENVESKALGEDTTLEGKSNGPENVEEVVAAVEGEETEDAKDAEDDVLGSAHYITEDGDEKPVTESDDQIQAEGPREDNAMEENLRMEPQLETTSPPLTPSDPEEVQKTAEPQEMTEEQVESQRDVETADLIQQPKPEQSLEKTSEEKGEPEVTENLQKINPNDGYSPEVKSETEEDLKTPEEDRLSMSAASGEDKVSSTTTQGSGDSKESSNEKLREVLEETPESTFTDETPLRSANEERKETSEEVSLKQTSGDGEGEEALQKMETPTDKGLGAEETILKEAKENEETESEDSTALKATQNQAEGDPNADDEITEAMKVQEEKTENSGETLLESALAKSSEEPGNDMETSPTVGDPSPEDGGTKNVADINEEPPQLVKSALEQENELESPKEALSGETVSEKENKENLEEEEEEEEGRVKAADPFGESEIETPKETGEETFVEEGNPNEEPEAEEDKETVAVTLDEENLKGKSEELPEISGERTQKEETVKSVLDQEDFEEDEEETLQAAKSKEESKMSEENVRNDEADEAEVLEKVLSDQNVENEDEESPLKAAADEESFKNGLNTEDEVSLKAALDDENQKTLEDEEETLKSANNGRNDEKVAMKAAADDDEAEFEDGGESPLGASNTQDEDAEDTLKASVKANDEETPEVETLKAANNYEDDEATYKSKENVAEEEGEASVRSENPENTQEPETLEDKSKETLLRAESFEELNNNIADDDESPLQSIMNPKEADLVDDISKDDSEDNLRSANVPYDLSNQIEEDEDSDPLQSINPLVNAQEPETLEDENRSETQDAEVDVENQFLLQATDPMHQKDSQVPSDNLQKPLKAGKIKVPTSIAKIMKDLGGKEKDISSIENLNPDKIDDIIDKIDEVEEHNKVIDEVDCRKECACAEDLDIRSRNRGRYEIAKDFLQWMKDLQLNRVLTDD